VRLSGGALRIEAETLVKASPEEVFAFLERLENHWLVTDEFVDLLSLDSEGAGPASDGGSVRIHGPLGISRTAQTRVVYSEPPRLLHGTAEVGRGTSAEVRWDLAPMDGGTRVALSATVLRADPLDRLALLLGGRTWLRRRFRATLHHLAIRVGANA
jgi:hypothetical protein